MNMEDTQITIKIPIKYLKAIEYVTHNFPLPTTVEDYLLECLQCGLKADLTDNLEQLDSME